MPRCDQNKTRWDEEEEIPADDTWLEEYFTQDEKLRAQAARSLDIDPLPGYGLKERNPDMNSPENEEKEHRKDFYLDYLNNTTGKKIRR